MDVQLEAARGKIFYGSLEHLNKCMPLYDVQRIELTTMLYGNLVRSVRFAPNASDSGGPYERARGYEMALAPSAPMYPCAFADMALGSGIVSFKIPPHSAQGAELLEMRSKTLTSLMQTVDHDDALGGLERPDAFTGLYWASMVPQQPCFAVTRAHSPAISAQLHDLIRDNEPETLTCVDEFVRMRLKLIARHNKARSRLDGSSTDMTEDLSGDFAEVAANASAEVRERRKREETAPYKTVEQFFFCTPKVRELLRAQKLHRVGVLVDTLAAAGIGSVCRTQRGTGDERHTRDEKIEAVIGDANTVDLTVDWVDQYDRTNPYKGIALLNNVTSSLAVTGTGFVVHGSPLDDVILFTGKPTTAASNGAIGMPISTGPMRSTRLSAIAAVTDVKDRLCNNAIFRPLQLACPVHNYGGRFNWPNPGQNAWAQANDEYAHYDFHTCTRLKPLALMLTNPVDETADNDDESESTASWSKK